MKTLPLLALLTLALSGCAVTPPPGTPISADQMSCDRETRIGSNLPTTRCRSMAQREAERRAAEKMGDNLRPGAATRDAGS
jgi:hypothetical protein